MARARSTLTVTIGAMNFFVRVDWSYYPGEPMVRYYADGSGYPGSPPEFDCIDSVECLECEYPMVCDDWDEDGLTRLDYWKYLDCKDRPGAFEIADRWVFDELSSGAYNDELFANAEGNDYV